MTEQQWLTCTDPAPMLEFLWSKASDRKLRLFVCACCRRIWPLLKDERSRKVVEVGEQFADALTDDKCREDALLAADRPMLALQRYLRKSRVPRPLPKALSAGIAARLACWPASSYAGAVDACVTHTRQALDPCGDPRLCDLMRDIFGNPFRPSPPLPQAVLAWDNSTAARIAQAIYDERDFGRLPVLGDALEEAGCTDADILAHCRSAGPHVRGCWVVDLILGKQ